MIFRRMAVTVFIAFLSMVLAASTAWAEFQVPPLTGPVVDAAGILNRSTQATIESALRALQEQGGSQITVLTVPSLEELTIEEAGIKIVDAWRLGGRGADNGVLFLIAPRERKMRIEVGRGLEGALTDVESKRIIDDSVRPLFRAGDYNSGILVGVYQITRKTDPGIDLTPYFEGRMRRVPTSSEGISPLGLFLIFFILFLLMSRGRSRRRLYRGSPGWGGPVIINGGRGGWGSSGGGGGGWSGGGGGFAGGGASGDW